MDETETMPGSMQCPLVAVVSGADRHPRHPRSVQGCLHAVERASFLRTVAKIRKTAKIDPQSSSLRHGCNTEGGNANLIDAQLRALSGHRSASMTHALHQEDG